MRRIPCGAAYPLWHRGRRRRRGARRQFAPRPGGRGNGEALRVESHGGYANVHPQETWRMPRHAHASTHARPRRIENSLLNNSTMDWKWSASGYHSARLRSSCVGFDPTSRGKGLPQWWGAARYPGEPGSAAELREYSVALRCERRGPRDFAPFAISRSAELTASLHKGPQRACSVHW
jgi:hypothetical protein